MKQHNLDALLSLLTSDNSSPRVKKVVLEYLLKISERKQMPCELFEFILSHPVLDRLLKLHTSEAATDPISVVVSQVRAESTSGMTLQAHNIPFSEKLIQLLFNSTCFKYVKMGKKLN